MYVGEAALNAVMVKSEAFVVEAEKVENGRVKVVPVHGILSRPVTISME